MISKKDYNVGDSVKVWITRYWDTKGIYQAEGHIHHMDGYIRVDGKLYYGNTWHLTRKEALDYIKPFRHRKIKNLELKLKKLKEMQL